MRNLQQLVDSLCKYTPTCVLFILSSLTPFLPPLSLVPPQSVTGGGGGHPGTERRQEVPGKQDL